MAESKYKNVAVKKEVNDLLDKLRDEKGILKGIAVERALIEKYPKEAKEVGLKWNSEY